MKRALILTYNKIPDGDAGAVRQIVFAKMLQSLDYAVYIVGMGIQHGKYGNTCEFEGVPYCSFRNVDRTLPKRINNYFGYKKKLSDFLKKEKKYDLILVVDLPLNAMRYIERYAKKNDVTLIHDSVEWYSPEEFKLGHLSNEYLRKEYKNRLFFKKPWRIVAISSYLEQHFNKKNLFTCRIPVIMDTESIEYHEKNQSEKVIIVYAGNPGKKDCFVQVIEAIEMLERELYDKFELRIIGVNDNYITNFLGIPEARWKKTNNIKCLGRISRNEVLKYLEEADYTILFRQAELRYAKAGFSTKVPESLLTGTPVICNLSGDLGMYLNDGENAIIAQNNSCESISDALKRAIMISAEQRRVMQRKAYETAIHYFDYKSYIEIFKQLIEGK